MRTRATLLLAAVDALLALMLIAGLLSGRAPAPARPLVDEGVTRATALSVYGADPTELRRDAGGWSIVRGDASYPARADRVDAFLGALAAGTLVREVTDDATLLGQFGLLEPRVRRVVVEADGSPRELLFGDAAEAPGMLYHRVGDGQTVWLVEAPIDFYLGQTASFWAYLRLFPEDAYAGEAVRLTVELSGGGSRVAGATYSSLELSRGADDGWSAAVDGREIGVSAAGALAYARDLVDLVGGGFYEGSVDDLPTLATLGFLLADGRTYSVEVLTDGEALVLVPRGARLPGAEYGGLVYTASPERIARLVPDPGELSE